MSLIGWLDYSESEQQRMREIVDLFREKDTVDELGIGTVRDALADLLFPGLSTIQTRARYFLFVPWVYLRLEGERTPSDKAGLRARYLQTLLVESLKNGAATSGDGVIGWEAGSRVQRLPASVYWSGLGTFGIRRYQGSTDQYQRSLDSFYRVLRDHSKGEGDELHERMPTNWNSTIPHPPGDLWDETSLALSHSEADFLQQQIVVSKAGSLLAYFAQERVPTILDIDLPWLHPATKGIQSPLLDWLIQARIFSEVLLGAALSYNLMLARLTLNKGLSGPNADLVDWYQDELKVWAESIAARGTALAEWNLGDLWQTVAATKHRVSVPTRLFIEHFVGFTKQDPHHVAQLPEEMQELIKTRELKLKGGQARLHSLQALKMWSGASGVRQLDYRWSTARRILDDIHQGLNNA